MRSTLEDNQGHRVYIFTTHGLTYVGVIIGIEEEVVRLQAPDGVTELTVAIGDVSGVRLYDQGAEGAAA